MHIWCVCVCVRSVHCAVLEMTSKMCGMFCLPVMVRDVVVGGPAYQEGQLQIGILLSIDGKSVFGESYNMVSIN